MGRSWGSCLAAHWKVFRYQLLLRFASFFWTFLKWDNVLKTAGVRKKDLTWDLQKKQLCVLGSSGFLTTAAGNGPNWKLVQQSTVGHELLAKSSLNQQWNLIWSGLGASLKDCQLQSVPVTGRLTQSCAHDDSYWWSDSTLVVLPLLKQPFSQGWLESLEMSWMNRVVSCLGVREQWFTGGITLSPSVMFIALPCLVFLDFCSLRGEWPAHHRPIMIHRPIGDCPLLSKQYFFSVSQNPSLTLLILFLQLLSPVYPQGRLSPLFSCLCCGTDPPKNL